MHDPVYIHLRARHLYETLKGGLHQQGRGHRARSSNTRVEFYTWTKRIAGQFTELLTSSAPSSPRITSSEVADALCPPSSAGASKHGHAKGQQMRHASRQGHIMGTGDPTPPLGGRNTIFYNSSARVVCLCGVSAWSVGMGDSTAPGAGVAGERGPRVNSGDGETSDSQGNQNEAVRNLNGIASVSLDSALMHHTLPPHFPSISTLSFPPHPHIHPAPPQQARALNPRIPSSPTLRSITLSHRCPDALFAALAGALRRSGEGEGTGEVTCSALGIYYTPGQVHKLNARMHKVEKKTRLQGSRARCEDDAVRDLGVHAAHAADGPCDAARLACFRYSSSSSPSFSTPPPGRSTLV
ncbi:hypothetical protein CVT25_002832 [Psilocybe cyanescens]|uniref:Uncharacterized protein n=1 Tax=Psilocybe cyanescens TaxID=93625 RepID=A0A409WL70_PSICY|nr:hypothetical protein CVT25_002832 [Psilocybe cyanescens]